MKSFIETGEALKEVRDSQLYRCGYKTFQEYCREKWGWKRDYCDKLIQGAAVVKQLPGKLHTIVGSEGQARELAKVEPEKRAEILEKASQAGPVTAKSIRQAAQEIAPPAPSPAPTADAQLESAMGIGIGESVNFFASQIEDICEAATADGSKEQIAAVAATLKTQLRKLSNLLTNCL